MSERGSPTEALIYAEEESLTFSTSTVDARVPAEGGWIGVTRMPVKFLAGLAEALPEGDPVVFHVDRDHLRIGTLRLSCRWQTEIGARLLLPPDLGLAGLLRLYFDAPRALIERSGFAPAVNEASSRLWEMVERVQLTLEDLGVTEDDVREMIKQCVRRSTPTLKL